MLYCGFLKHFSLIADKRRMRYLKRGVFIISFPVVMSVNTPEYGTISHY
ncbi:hypothetical Protein YC6258_05611 [Gynuella sunshinyii YC6258]|uniref:Uncharacterized protein n=1 Tax=Gynuella sunshinyii YC6258 TaxID=1445510 RepID=A0A0C5W4V4_9GAMM|nr:hypothetical Protein YC6258_05611 [Gynuella sunshinyii YC6258]